MFAGSCADSACQHGCLLEALAQKALVAKLFSPSYATQGVLFPAIGLVLSGFCCTTDLFLKKQNFQSGIGLLQKSDVNLDRKTGAY